MKKLFLIISLFILGCQSQQSSQKPVTSYYVTAFQLEEKPLQIEYKPNALDYYPSFSKRSDEVGSVQLKIKVDQSGSVVDTVIVKSSSIPRLDRAASEIAKRYRFTPLKDKSSSKEVNFLVNFNGAEESLSPPKADSPTRSPPSKVIVRIIYDETGSIDAVTIVESSGKPKVDENALKVAGRYQFKPYIVDGKPVKISTNLQIIFNE